MRSISPTSVRMLIDESQQADIVQGYAYHAKSYYQACQFVAEHGDQVCPAKWQPGAATLKPRLDVVGAL